jgi:hypothetical protein
MQKTITYNEPEIHYGVSKNGEPILPRVIIRTITGSLSLIYEIKKFNKCVIDDGRLITEGYVKYENGITTVPYIVNKQTVRIS